MYKKNILLVAYNNLGVGGVQYVISQVVKLTSEGYHYDVVVFEDGDYYYDSFIKMGVNIIRLNLPKRKSTFRKIWWQLKGKNEFFYKSFEELIKKNKYDIIHSFRELDSYPIFKVARKHNINKRIMHVNVMHTKHKNLLLRFITNRQKHLTLKYSTNIIFVSEQSKRQLLGERTNDKWMTIYNPYDLSKYHYYSKQDNDNKIVIIHVASLSSNKNQLFTVKVFNEILKLHRDSYLYIMGDENEDGYKDIVINYIKQNKIPNTIIKESTFDITTISNNLSYYILPSKKEAAPLVSIEAQAQGLKIFASTAVSEEMNCGGLIRLSLIESPSFWASKIYEDFKKNKNNRIKYDTERFSFDSFKRKLIDIYNN